MRTDILRSYNDAHSRFSHAVARVSFLSSGDTFSHTSAWYASIQTRSAGDRSESSIRFLCMGLCGMVSARQQRERGAYHREMLEAEVALLAEIVRRVHLAHDDDVLDPDSEPTVGVVSGL